MTKTLYVSDLDGTLLTKKQVLSEFTVKTINSLVEQGMIFSYATGRSLITAGKVTAALSAKIPVIVYNGSFILERGTQRKLLSNCFSPTEARNILDLLIARQIYPIVYSYIDGEEKFSYCPHLESRGMKIFQDPRRGDIRDNPVTDVGQLYRGDMFYFTCIDEPEKLFPVYELLKDELQCIYHKDIYSGEQWLEILPRCVSKANAILELKRLMGCDRVVCFGDGKNDISMFRVADECYAVENADPELKRIATAIIGSNECDGVAKWLAENYVKPSDN